MAQIGYRANIGAASFPLIAENFGQSVIMGRNDQNMNYFLNSTEDLDRDIGIPQLYYGHNIFPVAEGFQSIGYNKLIEATSPGETEFAEVFLLRDANENKAYFSHTVDGRNFISLDPFYSWINTTAIPAAVASSIVVTVAHVSGETYIYFSNVGCYKYDFASNSLLAVTLTSLTATDILGIVAANGYLIAYSATAIAWSSTLDPTDFTPSSVTGAGSSSIAATAGKIVTCTPSQYGFLVHTTGNCVEANYSGNAAYPFNFPELRGSGGIAGAKMIAASTNSATTYVYSTKGLQAYSPSNATTLFPEITDFVAGAYFEDFDESTLTFSRQQLTATMLKRVTLISDRYLIISYGITEYTHAIVVDLAQKRFGKFKITHVACFEWSVLSSEIQETPKKSIAFLQKTGAVQVVDFDVADEYTNGVAILGKYQFVRPNLVDMQTVEISSVRVANNFYAYHMGELVGKEDIAASALTLISNVGGVRTYGVDKIAKNHSFIFKGAFYLSDLELLFNIAGTL